MSNAKDGTLQSIVKEHISISTVSSFQLRNGMCAGVVAALRASHGASRGTLYEYTHASMRYWSSFVALRSLLRLLACICGWNSEQEASGLVAGRFDYEAGWAVDAIYKMRDCLRRWDACGNNTSIAFQFMRTELQLLLREQYQLGSAIILRFINLKIIKIYLRVYDRSYSIRKFT